jgi:hypothetical protein
VAQLLSEISSEELTEWMAYAELEPFGEERADLRSATVAAVIANANRDRKKRPQPYKVSDFMPKFDRQEQTEEDMLAVAEAWVKALGGRDLRKKEGAPG